MPNQFVSICINTFDILSYHANRQTDSTKQSSAGVTSQLLKTVTLIVSI